MKKIEINRGTYDIYNAFPQVQEFPVFDKPNPKVAVLVRLFTMADYPPISHKFVHMAMWSMRSHMLNSDMKEYKPSVVFHIEEQLFETARPIFEQASVPPENIIVFPTDICPTTLTGNALHKAVAPLVDPQLEKFERVIVLDADSFSLGNEQSGLIPLIDVSLNEMPPDQISLLRSWTTWDPVRDEYHNWYDHGGPGKEAFLEKAAYYSNTTTETIESILYPDNPKLTPRPFHNGAYISFSTRLLRDNPEFRQFIHEVSGTMGNEEIAIAIWAIKHYIKTGKLYPRTSLQDYIFAHDRFRLHWDTDLAWKEFHEGHPCLLHIYTYNEFATYVYDWAHTVHASESEAVTFGDTIIADVQKLRQPV